MLIQVIIMLVWKKQNKDINVWTELNHIRRKHLESGKVYKHIRARDIVFFCVALHSNNTASGYYMNCHYFENGSRPDLFLCTDDLFNVINNDQEWKEYTEYEGTINI